MKAVTRIAVSSSILVFLSLVHVTASAAPSDWLLAANSSHRLPRSIVTQLPCEPHPSNGRLLISIPTPYGRFYIDRDRYLNLIEFPPAPLKPETAGGAPFSVGTETDNIPSGFQTLLHKGETLFYSRGNFFAYQGNTGFVVVEPPIGAHLNQLPAEAQPAGNAIRIPGATLQPVNRYGRIAYEIHK